MDNFTEGRTLPAINTFRQFNRPLSMLSPLDLSLRSSSSIPITPPSTPSPPRKRQRLMSEENHFWRPHAMMGLLDGPPQLLPRNCTPEFHNHVATHSNHGYQSETLSIEIASSNHEKDKSQIPVSSMSLHQAVGEIRNLLSEEETIVLTEDEDDSTVAVQEDCDEEYVDILSNDDELTPLQIISNENHMQPVLEETDRFLTRHQLVYVDKELHNQAINGLAKLFEKNFQNSSENLSKVYTDLRSNSTNSCPIDEHEESCLQVPHSENLGQPLVTKGSKLEKKRMKIRKQQLSTLDEDTLSPVSGTIIRKLRDDEELVVRKGDIDPAFNVVEITEEAKATIASIENKIGAYLCQLCRTLYDDAFQLAQHRCPRIVHIEYKCSECEKVFNCPANLASHRRWHKPKSDENPKKCGSNESSTLLTSGKNLSPPLEISPPPPPQLDGIFPCRQCGKSFRRQAYLKKHQTSHQLMNELNSLGQPASSSSSSPSSGHLPSYHSSNFIGLHSMGHPTNMVCHGGQYYQHYNNPHAKLNLHLQSGIRYPTLNLPQRMYTSLGDFYLSHNYGRVSAFQYVHNTNPNFRHQTQMPVPVK